ncbi:hypothetical protein HPB47_003195, partial [Ixodes persulcatus]
MQVFAPVITHVLFSTLLTALSADSPGCALLSHGHSVNDYYLPSVTRKPTVMAAKRGMLPTPRNLTGLGFFF